MSSLTRRQKEIGLVVLAVLFLLGLAAYSYFGIYTPARDAKLQSEQLLSSEREVLMALETQVKSKPIGEKISISDLQQKVSVEPLTDLILLQVEQAELISDTLALSIAFTEGPLELLQPVEGVENIQEVLTTVEIEAADYGGILRFIREIESMDRIMIIDAIDFGANPEVTQATEEDETLTASLTFSAFYRPDLIALLDTMPKVAVPAPAGKSNPLPQNDGTDLELETTTPEAVEVPAADSTPPADTDEDSVDVSKIDAQDSFQVAGLSEQIHQIQAGDTLSAISLEYFGDADKVAELQEANGLDSTMIFTGNSLIIPELT